MPRKVRHTHEKTPINVKAPVGFSSEGARADIQDAVAVACFFIADDAASAKAYLDNFYWCVCSE